MVVTGICRASPAQPSLLYLAAELRGAVPPRSPTPVANTAQTHRLDAAFGQYTFAASVGQAVGPAMIIAFGFKQPIPDTGALFLAGLAISVLLTALSFGLGQRRATYRRHELDQVGSVRTLFRLPGLARALITSCVILAAVDISLVYLPALGAERFLGAAVIGVLLALRAGASMVSRLSSAHSPHGLVDAASSLAAPSLRHSLRLSYRCHCHFRFWLSSSSSWVSALGSANPSPWHGSRRPPRRACVAVPCRCVWLATVLAS